MPWVLLLFRRVILCIRGWEVDARTDGLCRGKNRLGVAPRMGYGTGWGLGMRRRDADIWRSIISGHIILL